MLLSTVGLLISGLLLHYLHEPDYVEYILVFIFCAFWVGLLYYVLRKEPDDNEIMP